jgi:hypothetical protein
VDEDELIARLASLPEREVPEDELESLATQSGVAVCGTWPDSTKPHRFDYEALKGDELIQKSEPVGFESLSPPQPHARPRTVGELDARRLRGADGQAQPHALSKLLVSSQSVIAPEGRRRRIRPQGESPG